MNNSNQLVIVCRNIAFNQQNFSNPIYVGLETGCLALIEQNLKTAFFCGDFDSVTEKQLALIQQYQKKHQIELIQSVPEKDFIDAELAITIAQNKLLNFQKIFIISDGYRWDMILAQINLIRKYSQYQVTLIDSHSYAFALLENQEFTFNKQLLEYDYISIFTLTDLNATYQFFGCKYYPEQLITVNKKDVLAISNEFEQNVTSARIKIIAGDCLIILTKKEKKIKVN